MSHAKLYPLALLLLIGGCAGPIGYIHVSDKPPPPPVTAFDGSYRNTIRATRVFGAAAQPQSWCDTSGQPIITVQNGMFTYAVPHPNIPGDATPAFPATLSPDGSFYGQVIEGSITGQVSGTHIEGRIDGSACIYTFSGNRT